MHGTESSVCNYVYAMLLISYVFLIFSYIYSLHTVVMNMTTVYYIYVCAR